MAVSARTKIKVWGQAAGRCAHCKEQLIYSEDLGIHESLVGEVCHIFAQSDNGPRANKELSPAERDSSENLILLCKKHHKYVDDHPDLYPPEELVKMKIEHVLWITKQLEISKSWNFNLSTIQYLNIPRLTILNAMSGNVVTYDIDTSKGLHSLAGDLLGVLLAYQDLLEKMHPRVCDMPNFAKPLDEQIGMIFKFDDRFRSKNGAYPDRNRDYSNYLSGNLSKDPYIYKKFEDWKLVMGIDPMWLTTSTAFSDFITAGGQNKFSGLALIKSIDYEAKQVVATPLVIGIPKSPLHDIFNMPLSDMPRSIEL